MKHTPGPWTPKSMSMIEDAVGVCVAYVGKELRVAETVRANADLIATAPELLQSLETLARHWTNQSWLDEGSRFDLDRALTVIAKAKGES